MKKKLKSISIHKFMKYNLPVTRVDVMNKDIRYKKGTKWELHRKLVKCFGVNQVIDVQCQIVKRISCKYIRNK